jgi:hypothetical protein
MDTSWNKLMKKCFLNLEFIERFTWDNDGNEYILSENQRECMSCCYFKKCYAFSLGRTVGRILVQLEMINHLSDEDNDNGDSEIVDIEVPLEDN